MTILKLNFWRKETKKIKMNIVRLLNMTFKDER